MPLRKIFFNAIVTLIAFFLLATWLILTNSGLQSALTFASWFAPLKVSFKNIEGTFSSPTFSIQNVNLVIDSHKIHIKSIDINWRQKKFTLRQVAGINAFIPQSELLVTQDIGLDTVHGNFVFFDNTTTMHATVSGGTQHAKIFGTLHTVYTKSAWQIQHLDLTVGKNLIRFSLQQDNAYAWQINLAEPGLLFKNSTGNLIANGNVHGVDENFPMDLNLTANVQSKNLTLDRYQLHNLHADVKINAAASSPLHVDIGCDKLTIDTDIFTQIKIKTHGILEKHSLLVTMQHENTPFSLTADAKFTDQIWQATNLQIAYQREKLHGSASFNFKTNAGLINLQGKLFDIGTEINIAIIGKQHIELQANMRANQHNYLTANVNLLDKNLSGNIKLCAQDMALLMRWMPDVTRLKAKLVGSASLSGTLATPAYTLNAHLTDITATLPALGVKIKPAELHISGDEHGKFMLHGKGNMRRGPGEFSLQGHIEPFKPNIPNAFTVTANNLEFIKNATAHLIAGTKLQLHYAFLEQRLDIQGDIIIQEGAITLADKREQTVKSKDVIFVNEPKVVGPSAFTINPTINLRIEDNVHFAGLGLDADISGKLDIMQRNDALYADGRITIKQGSFQLPGQKLSINKGRLLYPPGTLLVNPVLDIKMKGLHQGQDTNNTAEPALELNVQGTAQKPVFSESGLASNKDLAISQALLTGTSMLSHNLLQEKLKVSEIGLTSHNENNIDFFDNPSKMRNQLKNKDFVIGRPLGKNFYVQYLVSMDQDKQQRVRLKYMLNKTWGIGVESGTEGGGADLTFSIERD